MAGREQNATGCLSLADDVRGSGRAQDAILADEQLLDAVCSSNLCDELDDFGVPVSSIASDDQEAILDAFGDGEEDAGHESFAVVGLLEHDDLLPQARAMPPR